MNQVIVGLGEALWDVLPEGRKIGGAPANFAYHTGQFGLETLAVSALGNDALGDEIVEKFDARGLKYLLPMRSRKVWLGITFPSHPNSKTWPVIAAQCAGDRWRSAIV